MKTPNFQLRIFRTPLSKSEAKDFEKCFELWDQVWSEANSEIGRASAVASDMLTRQHEILALYDGDEPIALTCLRYVDFSLESTYRDSYFLPEIWHEEDKQKLRQYSGFGVIGNQITIRRDYRKTSAHQGIARGIEVKSLISYLIFEYAQRLNIDLFVSMVRSDKGLDRVFYECGARPLVKQRKYRNIIVDLLTFHPKESPIVIPDHSIQLVQSLLWSAENKLKTA